MSTDNLPPVARGALTALNKEFEELHRMFGDATRSQCHAMLTGIWGDDDDHYVALFIEWFDRYPAIASHYRDLLGQNTLSSHFRAYFDFYIELIAIGVRRIFAELIEIGNAHEADGIAWAKAQAGDLVRDHRHFVADWVRVACERRIGDPWQAPLFLTIKPAGNVRDDPERATKRMDSASSQKLLDSFADEYERRLKNYIEKYAGEAYIKAAKQPKSAAKTIEGKLSKGSEPAAQRSQEDAEAKTWQELDKRVKNDPPDATLNRKQTAFYFHKDERTIYNWLERGWLKLSGTGITIESIRGFKLEGPPKKRKKRARKNAAKKL